ncbi:MAG: Wadjet anti-phage system protein JetD domain-containing protein [Rhodoglobus sp.]
MISVDDCRAKARALTQRQLRVWAADPLEAAAAQLIVALHPPVERDVLTNGDQVLAWRAVWQAVESIPGIDVDWANRAWPSVGNQSIPVRLTVTGAGPISAFAGSVEHWEVAQTRGDHVRRRLGDTLGIALAIRSQTSRIVALTDDDFETVVDVAGWLVQHPATGFRPRQVPIRGVDSKWLGSHRALVTALVTAVNGSESLGLVDSDPLVRLRVLDETLHPGGPFDFGAPVSQCAAMRLAPRTVLVVENLESLLAMPPLPGVVSVHGSGFAVGILDRIPWIATTRVVYWGDLDSQGFAVLHTLRSHHSDVSSVLMDTATLEAHRDLAVIEPIRATGSYSTLTSEETAALAHLREWGNLRLEQERIPWDYAIAAVERAVTD